MCRWLSSKALGSRCLHIVIAAVAGHRATIRHETPHVKKTLVRLLLVQHPTPEVIELSSLLVGTRLVARGQMSTTDVVSMDAAARPVAVNTSVAVRLVVVRTNSVACLVALTTSAAAHLVAARRSAEAWPTDRTCTTAHHVAKGTVIARPFASESAVARPIDR